MLETSFKAPTVRFERLELDTPMRTLSALSAATATTIAATNAREDFYLHRIRLSRMGSCEKFKSPFRPPFFKGGVAEERK
jgi:hypothetical protein